MTEYQLHVIRKISRMNVLCPYSFSNWAEWTGNNYPKAFFDVMTGSGEIVKNIWPNAGNLGNYPIGTLCKLSSGGFWEKDND